MPIDSPESRNRIMDHIIQSLPPDNDSFYIRHKKSSSTFRIKEDPNQKDKDRLYQLILNSAG